MKFFKTLAITGLILSGLAACNTIDGIGQDMREGGAAVQDAAN